MGMRIDFEGSPYKGVKKPAVKLRPHVEEFLAWELRKIELDMKCSFTVRPKSLFIDIRNERIGPPGDKECECCGEKSGYLRHFTRYGYDEFLYSDCYTSYLLCMDN